MREEENIMSNVFRKYPKISQSYDAKTLEHIALMGLYAHDVRWSCSNKLHGANLAIYCDGIGMEIASRNGMLGENESFYNVDSIKPELFRIASTLNAYFKDDVKIYGELFGGSYPHSDVPKTNMGMIQKGVFYCADIQFSVFDILVGDTFLSVEEMEEACLAFDIMHQESIFEGTLQECLDYPNDFEDPTYKKFGLPKLEGNITEGIVVKPVKVRFFGSGSRVILKSKNEKFAEKNNAKKRIPKDIEPLSKEMTETLENFSQYINMNRLDTATSKLGEVEQKLIGAFLKELHQDVILDAIADGFEPDYYDKSEMKIINKFINTKSKELIFARLKGEI